MIRLVFDCKNMYTKEITHLYIKHKLKAPEYYGKNLDALWDILTSYDRKLEVSFINIYYLIKNLGSYGEEIIKLFQDAEKENPNISVEFGEDGCF